MLPQHSYAANTAAAGSALAGSCGSSAATLGTQPTCTALEIRKDLVYNQVLPRDRRGMLTEKAPLVKRSVLLEKRSLIERPMPNPAVPPALSPPPLPIRTRGPPRPSWPLKIGAVAPRSLVSAEGKAQPLPSAATRAWPRARGLSTDLSASSSSSSSPVHIWSPLGCERKMLDSARKCRPEPHQTGAEIQFLTFQ